MNAVGSRNASGFTLIEVMVSIVVLAFGLLGFALLQTLTVRYSQSAAYKTQATNLGYSLLDDMRANRLSAAQYAGAATFAQGSIAAGSACIDGRAPAEKHGASPEGGARCRIQRRILVGRARLERATNGLKVRCSTD